MTKLRVNIQQELFFILLQDSFRRPVEQVLQTLKQIPYEPYYKIRYAHSSACGTSQNLTIRGNGINGKTELSLANDIHLEYSALIRNEDTSSLAIIVFCILFTMYDTNII